MALTRLQRNEIFRVIAANDLDPTEFKFDQNAKQARITYIKSGAIFKITFFSTGKVDRFLAQSDVDDGHHRRERYTMPFEDLLPWIAEWAQEAMQTFDEPDLWVEMQRTRELVVGIQWADAINTPFTNDERRQIRVELEGIKENVKEQFNLTDDQIARIDERLDEAAEAAERIGRKDWRLLAYGTVLNLFVTDALPPEVARHILAMFVHVVVVLFGGGPPQILT